MKKFNLAVSLVVSAAGLCVGADAARAQCAPSYIYGGAEAANYDYFGQAMASDANTLVVGEPGHNEPTATEAGAVVVFNRYADGFPWVRSQLLTEGMQAGYAHQFGQAVDIDAGTIVVGAPGENTAGHTRSGAVRIYTKIGATWTLQTTILNPSIAANDEFGTDVAISGDDLLIGAPGDDTVGLNSGRVHFYHRTGTTWTLVDSFSGQGQTNLLYGGVLDMWGNVAVIGQPNLDWTNPTVTDTGGLVFYRKQANGHWAWENTWHSNGDEYARMGDTVVLGPNRVAYSVPGMQWLPTDGKGVVYYCYNADAANIALTWHETDMHVLRPTGSPTVEGFGTSISLDGDRVLAGTESGPYRAYLFSDRGETVDRRYAAPTGASSGFGMTGVLNGHSILIGDFISAINGQSQGGVAFNYSDEWYNGANTCEDAFPIYYGQQVGCTATATPSDAAKLGVICGTSAASNDVWFAVNTRPTTSMILDTEGSSFDTVLSLHSSCNSASLITCDDDSGTGNMSRLEIPAQAATTLLIRVSGYNGASGAFKLNLNPGCGSSDFNADGDTGTDADIEAFFACLAGSCCPSCGSADFNGDGDTGTDADIEAFFSVLAGGAC